MFRLRMSNQNGNLMNEEKRRPKTSVLQLCPFFVNLPRLPISGPSLMFMVMYLTDGLYGISFPLMCEDTALKDC